MILKILTLKNKVEEAINFDEKFNISVKTLQFASTKSDYEVHIYGTVTRRDNIFVVEGFVDVDLCITCDRCMQEVVVPLHAPLFCEFSTDEKYLEENEDVKEVTKSSIDLSDAILESIAMNIPMKNLCNEDCKGMCKGCGTNLNKNTCKCETLEIDPRLEQLKNIFG
ncbi:MAG: YceD family protein [Cellulosilyticaceae bacterium]